MNVCFAQVSSNVVPRLMKPTRQKPRGHMHVERASYAREVHGLEQQVLKSVLDWVGR